MPEAPVKGYVKISKAISGYIQTDSSVGRREGMHLLGIDSTLSECADGTATGYNRLGRTALYRNVVA
jgi:hypothetical protein